MKKLDPSSLEIGTYTNDTVKIIGSCMLYLVHPDTKKLTDVTFYIAVNDDSVLLSCKTTLMLHLIQPRSRLDYLLPRASLITSSANHPKTPSLHCMYRSRKCSLKDLHKKWPLKHQERSIQSQSWSQAKTRFCINTQRSSKGLSVSQVLHITYSLTQVLVLSRLLVIQCQSTLKKHLSKKCTKCCKQECLNQFMRQHLGLIALFL